MKPKILMTVCGGLLILTGCNQNESSKTDSTTITNEMRDLKQNAPPVITNSPPISHTNQPPPAPK